MNMLDSQPTLVQRLMRHGLLPRAPAAHREKLKPRRTFSSLCQQGLAHASNPGQNVAVNIRYCRVSTDDQRQRLHSARRQVSRVAYIAGPFWMRHAPLVGMLVAQMAIDPAPSGFAGILPGTPAAGHVPCA